MSIFYCHQCDNLRDADDGCEEIAGELVCVDCAELDDGDPPGHCTGGPTGRPLGPGKRS